MKNLILKGLVIGAGLSLQGDTLSAEPQELPIAGESTLGEIKVGAGLGMTGDSLNCTAYNFSYGEVPENPLPGWIAFGSESSGSIYSGRAWLPFCRCSGENSAAGDDSGIP